MKHAQTQKSTDQSNIKPYLLVEYQGNGRPAFRLLNIKHAHFNNPGSQVNKNQSPVHISKVIADALGVILSRVSRYFWGVD